MNAKLFCVTIIIFFNTMLCSAGTDYTTQAHAWLKKYVINSSGSLMLSTHDARQVANLLYYSYTRSAATLEAQHQALALMQTTWKSWENITHTRMNPAKKHPHELLTEKDVEMLHEYVATQEMYHHALEAYATVSEFVVKGTSVHSLALKDGIKELRTAARKVVAQALLDVQKHVAQLAAYSQARKSISDENQTKTSLKEFFSVYVPKLAVSSFTETEHSTNTLSNESWRLLFGMQEISSYVWNTLETQRAAFYKEHYQALYDALQKSPARTTIFSSIVEENKKLPSLHLQEFKFCSN